MASDTIRIGIVGFGGFGLFAAQQFAQVPGVQLAAISGTHREAARKAAERFGLPDVMEIENMLAMPDVDLVYISTPPFLHYSQAMQALAAGKHVIVEKPLAMSVLEADEMIALAQRNDLLLSVNLMQRYNPLFDRVDRLVKSGVLGAPLHGFFENYAADEGLAPEHWFWDREKSGGIFIEHGVHFFDLFAGWLGDGAVRCAGKLTRSNGGMEDQVYCTASYGSGEREVPVFFYHGFTQPGRMDRQELRLLFERGDITLEEWVPTRLRLRAAVDESSTRILTELFPLARIDVESLYGAKEREILARHKPYEAYQKFTLTFDEAAHKMTLYGQLLRSMIEDQCAYIRDRTHVRKVTEQNGRDSLAMAEAAAQLAGSG